MTDASVKTLLSVVWVSLQTQACDWSVGVSPGEGALPWAAGTSCGLRI